MRAKPALTLTLLSVLLLVSSTQATLIPTDPNALKADQRHRDPTLAAQIIPYEERKKIIQAKGIAMEQQEQADYQALQQELINEQSHQEQEKDQDQVATQEDPSSQESSSSPPSDQDSIQQDIPPGERLRQSHTATKPLEDPFIMSPKTGTKMPMSLLDNARDRITGAVQEVVYMGPSGPAVPEEEGKVDDVGQDFDKEQGDNHTGGDEPAGEDEDGGKPSLLELLAHPLNKIGPHGQRTGPDGVTRISGFCPDAGLWCAQAVEGVLIHNGVYNCTGLGSGPELVGICNACKDKVCYDSAGITPPPPPHYIHEYTLNAPPSYRWITCPVEGTFCGYEFETPSGDIPMAMDVWGMPPDLVGTDVYSCSATGAVPQLAQHCESPQACDWNDIVNKSDAQCVDNPRFKPRVHNYKRHLRNRHRRARRIRHAAS